MAFIDPFNIGNDLMGAAIAAAIATQARGRITISHRQEAKTLIISQWPAVVRDIVIVWQNSARMQTFVFNIHKVRATQDGR